ncbi:uncharacterized protein N7443_010989 [Penicillium atrosanguineum]|uniref:uncharacterized protein n=1 Tax=Penicillium atrosanguineum TaxID=1132637 RepID=UPI00238C6421|nr:uncharacterized protein N7443_010989 [Penicillium atrosanguineum]KAJ5290736.1 hypothetical protein N7443_010989 [Penicillium atrosanguineum]
MVSKAEQQVRSIPDLFSHLEPITDLSVSIQIIRDLQANWIWVPNWVDSSENNTAGRVVHFFRIFSLISKPTRSMLHFSADTRYKLYIDGKHVAVSPSRSGLLICYYETLDIAPYLKAGHNEIRFVVVRYFAASRSAMAFERTALPGLTVIGHIETSSEVIDLSCLTAWESYVDNSIQFPLGLADDVFLHISERISPTKPELPLKSLAYNIKTLNGDIPPWNLHPRSIPVPESTPAVLNNVRTCKGAIDADSWTAFFTEHQALPLSSSSTYTIEVQADVHSTAFLRWSFKAVKSHSQLTMRPRSYPFFRSKADRLDASVGHIVGPYDELTLDLPGSEVVIYEPFWFRTFRLLRIEIILRYYHLMLPKLITQWLWKEPGDAHSKQIWDVSIRTMRTCMFDGYSDCPFYEQLQYPGDSRSVCLFHYLLSGDDQLMRQAITNFAASVTPEGLTQSQFPSHVPQVIAGFSLFWILQVCDQHLFFGDTRFARGLIPRIDGVLEFFHAHVDHFGLISGLPEAVWQYVDWVTTWGATNEHPDKGVPTSGRKSNRHTYFSMLYAWVLQKVARLVRDVGRPGHAFEYEARATSLLEADGQYFTDSTANVADELSYSQYCQVFAVISGAAHSEDHERILAESFSNDRFSKCSYMMCFYAFRALALAGDEFYEQFWVRMWEPWRKMLAHNLSTWEEDDVRQRSDCHAWGSVPIYEYCTELAGIQPVASGSSKILFKPRLGLTGALEAKVALGKDNMAKVSWKCVSGKIKVVELTLEKPIEVVSRLPGKNYEEHGVVNFIRLSYGV